MTTANSGNGMSFTCKRNVILEHLNPNLKIIVIDPKAEYESLLKTLIEEDSELLPHLISDKYNSEITEIGKKQDLGDD